MTGRGSIDTLPERGIEDASERLSRLLESAKKTAPDGAEIVGSGISTAGPLRLFQIVASVDIDLCSKDMTGADRDAHLSQEAIAAPHGAENRSSTFGFVLVLLDASDFLDR